MVAEEKLDISKENQTQHAVTLKEPKIYSLESILSKILPLRFDTKLSVPYVAF
jgi:hypothetical protein